ncbi:MULTISPECIES: hypothetical protein [Arthrospira]|jgi:hypothetical protein|uniref:Uncharacterized protein n=1 Tax=Limnospira platensis NIES-46 TaxID=1236695 RepID=A0A5M3T9L2_LIMPL|nr:hypothetical protein [Arthrospira platensis]AMW28366.1 hypothetical protein AP285_10645 [Arthrospira platensis YZ]KDR56564.1 hypothetical protein APPUASWS_015835 [Arthrospira platensis str. Paraca]MBD2671154.1 hypothetical protein [Arthrospira platensis FACHB-439]MBD2712872.1 hypothetical protein [Arthrospira platensis FACHB-835]MDF2209551.1 hypothetical protein [Arthrospira platensis NCB002]MDT9185518.1 hypothetical protein [Limnospira sp. PMC 289.06]MDT9297673.1 hypothetical protein [Ar
MPWNNQQNSTTTPTQLINQILTSGKLTYVQYLGLMSLILSDTQITDLERHQINRIFDYVQNGRLTLITSN